MYLKTREVPTSKNFSISQTIGSDQYSIVITIKIAGISIDSYHSILGKFLKMHHVCQYTALRMLMKEQCDDRMKIYHELINTADNNAGILRR